MSLADLGLASHVLELLRSEGVDDLQGWRRLGRKRLAIFGIAPRTIKLLDAAAKRKRFEGCRR